MASVAGAGPTVGRVWGQVTRGGRQPRSIAQTPGGVIIRKRSVTVGVDAGKFAAMLRRAGQPRVRVVFLDQSALSS
jgi:hypothetical protein